MSLDPLSMLMPPPIRPMERPNSDQWAAVQSRWGILPNNYRDFIDAYGSGCIDEFIWIFNPAAANENINFSTQADRQIEALREINNAGLEAKMPLFPEPAGLLPLGITDNGDLIVWQTNGRPDEWIVGVVPSRSSPVLLFENDLIGFLSGLLNKKLSCEAFPSDFPSAEPSFSPTV